MIEIEVKARAKADTEDRIRAIGATMLGTESHVDLYFNSSTRDFRKTDEALRIRIKGDGARLTYKGPKLDCDTKSRLERTVKIDNPSEMEKILVNLGFLPTVIVRKLRTKYSLGDVILALDDVEGLGLFLEVEAKSESDWLKQKEKVLSILSSLGLGESIRNSYLELLEREQRKNLDT